MKPWWNQKLHNGVDPKGDIWSILTKKQQKDVPTGLYGFWAKKRKEMFLRLSN